MGTAASSEGNGDAVPPSGGEGEQQLPTQIYTAAEVAKHNTESDCWIIIGNKKNGGPKVYNITSYLPDHPGGKHAILDMGGQNADDMFEDAGHSAGARKILAKFLIGVLAEA